MKKALILILLCLGIFVPSASAQVSYPADGWLPPGASFSWQRADQGRDFVTNWNGIIQAPGAGCLVANGQDQAFPFGFGPSFPLVRINTGPFAGYVWYIGHTTSLLREGQCFKFGHPISRANQGRPSEIGIIVPGDGGWVELGLQEANGQLGPYDPNGHWFDSLLLKTRTFGTPWDIFPKNVWNLPFGQKASEFNTVKAYETANCKTPWIRQVCKSSGWHLRLLRDRIVWVAHHKVVNGKWVVISKPDWNRARLGQRLHRIEYDITH